MSATELEGLSLFRGDDLVLTNEITVNHPKISDIESIGESKYSELFSCISATSVDIADILCFELNIWYEDIKDEWEFFIQKCLMESKEISVRIEEFAIPVLEDHCLAIGDSYRDALNFFFKLSGEYIVLEKSINEDKKLNIGYARVSTQKQKNNLIKQSQVLRDYANQMA